MERIVLLRATPKAVTAETAQWFVEHGDTVYLGGTALSEYPDGVLPLEFDPFAPQSLEKAAKQLEDRHGRLDILILGTIGDAGDGEIGSGHSDEMMLDTLMNDTYGNLQIAEAFEPLLKNGLKRIAGITDVESSNTNCTGAANIGASAAAAAFNMMGRILYNHLRPEGFTFRWYCDDGKTGGMCAGEYIASALCYDPKEPYTHSDENRMVLRDAYLRELSW